MSEPSMSRAVPSPFSSPVEVPALRGRPLRWRQVGAGCLVVGVLALAGCGGSGGDAAGTASQSAAAESAASASASPAYEPATAEHPARNVPRPVMPEGANANSLAGARKFMQYFEDAMNYMIQTGDASYVEKATAKGSTHYRAVISTYNKAYKSGSWSKGTKLTFKNVDGDYYIRPEGYSYILMYVNRSSGGIFKGGREVESFSADNYGGVPHRITLTYEKNRWWFYSIEGSQGATYEK